MPGVLSHFSVALIGFLIIYFSFYKAKTKRKIFYGLAWVIGTLIPDTIKFGFTGLIYHTTDFYKILEKPIYWTLNYYTHHVVFWIIFFLIVFVLAFLLYKFKKIDKLKLKAWITADIIFLLSIIVHLIMDHYIIEKSYWI